MVSTEWLEAEVLKAVPDARVEVIDLHRSGDHFHVRITSPSFEGMRPLQRQKQVLNHMKQYIPHPVHAIDLKCMTPEQEAVTGDTAFDPMLAAKAFTFDVLTVKKRNKHGLDT